MSYRINRDIYIPTSRKVSNTQNLVRHHFAGRSERYLMMHCQITHFLPNSLGRNYLPPVRSFDPARLGYLGRDQAILFRSFYKFDWYKFSTVENFSRWWIIDISIIFSCLVVFLPHLPPNRIWQD